LILKNKEKKMHKNLSISMFILLIAVMLLSACGPSTVSTATESPAVVTEQSTTAPTEDPLAMYWPDAVSGDIISAGSSTVFPLSERMAQRFSEEGFTGNITIDSIGTGGGFERFCVNGETDIANASRTIKDTELASCQAISREPLAFRVGTDAIAVVVSSQNTFVTDVTLEELALIFSTATNWSDVRPDWPNEPIQRFIPGTDSGTFDYFVEKVFNTDEAPILAASNLQLSEDDNVLVQGVEGSPYAIGFFGFAYYQENAGLLKTVSINGIVPDEQTAEDNTYPLSRPLFLYSTAQILQEKSQVAAFIYFYLTHVNDEIVDVGYFPASQAALDEAINTWQQAVGR
jgi:phosphate transport system substrate-binding protein